MRRDTIPSPALWIYQSAAQIRNQSSLAPVSFSTWPHSAQSFRTGELYSFMINYMRRGLCAGWKKHMCVRASGRSSERVQTHHVRRFQFSHFCSTQFFNKYVYTIKCSPIVFANSKLNFKGERLKFSMTRAVVHIKFNYFLFRNGILNTKKWQLLRQTC